jgi:hypothetical protein
MLDFDFIEWDEPDAEGFSNVRHIEAAGLTPEDVEDVLYSPDAQPDTSEGSGRPAVFGWTGDGRRIIVVSRLDEEGGVRVLYPITAYEVPPAG